MLKNKKSLYISFNIQPIVIKNKANNWNNQNVHKGAGYYTKRHKGLYKSRGEYNIYSYFYKQGHNLNEENE